MTGVLSVPASALISALAPPRPSACMARKRCASDEGAAVRRLAGRVPAFSFVPKASCPGLSSSALTRIVVVVAKPLPSLSPDAAQSRLGPCGVGRETLGDRIGGLPKREGDAIEAEGVPDTGRRRSLSQSHSELFPQDPLIEIMSRVEQHPHGDLLLHVDVHPLNETHLMVIGN